MCSLRNNLNGSRRTRSALLACCMAIACFATPESASELKPETVAAFDHYVRVTEARMNDDLENDHFLAIDRLSDPRRQKAYDRIQHGEVYLEQLRTLDNGHPIRVPSGMIHHWVGVIFIPGATLSDVLAVLRDYDNHKNIYKPDIRESKLLEQNETGSKVYLQFYNKSIVTVVMNVNFDVEYTEFGSSRSQSASRSTRIAEVENVGKPNERERPVGKDHGYLWRLNSYWRVEEKDGGVYVQNESVALTRTVPVLLAWLINPLVKSIPRGVISNLLLRTREAVLKAQGSAAASLPGGDSVSLLATEQQTRKEAP